MKKSRGRGCGRQGNISYCIMYQRRFPSFLDHHRICSSKGTKYCDVTSHQIVPSLQQTKQTKLSGNCSQRGTDHYRSLTSVTSNPYQPKKKKKKRQNGKRKGEKEGGRRKKSKEENNRKEIKTCFSLAFLLNRRQIGFVNSLGDGSRTYKKAHNLHAFFSFV